MEKKLQIMPPRAGYYPTDDMPEYIEKILAMKQNKVRKIRKDLVPGMIVVVLEGQYAGSRVVFIKQVEENKAICIGPSSINSIPLFSIDERFLLKTSTILKISDYDLKDVKECSMDVNYENEDVETSELEQRIEGDLLKEIAKIKFMRTYLKTPFKAPENDHPLAFNY
ncbi:60s ribosomal protein L6 [Trachipleistophora hominis]|uniref:60s ribosomal protein L6 n=1 Tax=Trachipleistophora hominis TaxID=72359 RepID=L7JZH9_TRAHO|nr:60s ribosomal protein L6 [Trachipleistophora hominis]